MPTPAVAFLTRTLGVDAGIVISASHNPHYDNGIKFFSAQGEKLDDATELALEAALDVPFTAESEKLGKAVRAREAVGRYIEFCKASVPRASTCVACAWCWTARTAPPTRSHRCCSANWAPR
jgi:phosphoglucosamine mutase